MSAQGIVAIPQDYGTGGVLCCWLAILSASSSKVLFNGLPTQLTKPSFRYSVI